MEQIDGDIDQIDGEVTFMCCFCGDTCDGRIQVVLVQYTDDDREPDAQTWFSHFGCFELSLRPDARVFDEDEVIQ